ncbi:hypothetical protein GCM10028818_10470 [Spirosoma horti]
MLNIETTATPSRKKRSSAPQTVAKFEQWLARKKSWLDLFFLEDSLHNGEAQKSKANGLR